MKIKIITERHTQYKEVMWSVFFIAVFLLVLHSGMDDSSSVFDGFLLLFFGISGLVSAYLWFKNPANAKNPLSFTHLSFDKHGVTLLRKQPGTPVFLPYTETDFSLVSYTDVRPIYGNRTGETIQEIQLTFTRGEEQIILKTKTDWPSVLKILNAARQCRTLHAAARPAALSDNSPRRQQWTQWVAAQQDAWIRTRRCACYPPLRRKELLMMSGGMAGIFFGLLCFVTYLFSYLDEWDRWEYIILGILCFFMLGGLGSFIFTYRNIRRG